MPNPSQLKPAGASLGVVTILCWAAYNVAAKAGVDAGLSPAALTLLRYVTPGLVALPVWWILRRRDRQNTLPLARLVVLALLGGPLFGVVAVSGYQHAPLSHGLLFAPVAVFVSGSLWGAILMKEKLTATRFLGATIMFVGLAILVGLEPHRITAHWPLGIAFFILAGAMWGAYTALLRYWHIPLIEGTAAIASLSAISALFFVGPYAFASLAQADLPMLVLQTLMQGIVGGMLSVVALVAALRHLTAQTAAMLPTFTPAVAMLMAWIALGTRPATMEVLGAAIVFGGFAIAVQQRFAFVRWPFPRPA